MDLQANRLVMACDANVPSRYPKKTVARDLAAIENALELISCTISPPLTSPRKEDRRLEFIAASFARPGVPHVASIEMFGPVGGELPFAALWAAVLAVWLTVRFCRYPSVQRHDVTNSCLP